MSWLRCVIAMVVLASGFAMAGEVWLPPGPGPAAKPGKRVLFIGQHFKNGGISSVFRSFNQAARLLGWQVTMVDGQDDPARIRRAMQQALQERVEGVALGGVSLRDCTRELHALRQAGIVLVGWHVAARPGPAGEVFVNVSTDPQEVARLAAAQVVASHAAPAGVVIFTDDRFEVAIAKSRAMQDIVARCRYCRVLAVENLPLSTVSEQMAPRVAALAKRFGRQWTHTLAINDLYFDEINYPLLKAGLTSVQNIAAGDGSEKAIGRIRAGYSSQMVTVAEPINVQGWQLADEMNRAFAGAPPSGWVSHPVVVTHARLQAWGSRAIDADLPYQSAYRAVWFPK